MPEYDGVLVEVIACPQRLCGNEFEGTWKVPEAGQESPADELQLCPECGRIFTGRWPGAPLT